MTETESKKGCLYLFLDEGGDLGFNPKGSRYWTFSAVTAVRPFVWDVSFTEYKYDLLEWGLDIQGFHAAQDNRHVRKRVLGIIAGMSGQMRIDSVIVEKAKTGPALQREERFYPRMLGYLVRYVIQAEHLSSGTQVVVVTDTIPLLGKRRAIEKSIKETLANMLPATVSYKVLHHTSMSCCGLQVADYCNWAIFKKWERGDTGDYSTIQSAIRSEFDIFESGSRLYY